MPSPRSKGPQEIRNSGTPQAMPPSDPNNVTGNGDSANSNPTETGSAGTNNYKNVNAGGSSNQINGSVGAHAHHTSSERVDCTSSEQANQLNGTLDHLPKGFFYDRTGKNGG